jgi:threonine/homoserine/homoserine lactone efflux protein
MVEHLGQGTLLGLVAGLSPGPMLVLVIAETLRYNIPAGLKVSVAPLITDAPIILLSLFIFSPLSGFRLALGLISLIGGCFLLYLASESLRCRGIETRRFQDSSRSLSKAVAVNFLNPNPYLFWFSVGAPLTAKAWDGGSLPVIAFLGSFYLFLVGSKMVLAMAVGRSRRFLQGRTYIWLMRMLGGLLVLFSVLFFKDAWKYISGLS